MRHRRVVRISTNAKQKQDTECRQYAIERFHGSLRCGLSIIFASANHTNCPATNQATFWGKWNPIPGQLSVLSESVVFWSIGCSAVDEATSPKRGDRRRCVSGPLYFPPQGRFSSRPSIAPAEGKVKALEERRRMIEAELTKSQ